MKKKKKGSSSTKGAVDFGRHLRKLNRGLDKAKEAAASSGFDEFDDGKYRAKAVDAKIGISKNKRIQVVLTWKFTKGDYKGKEKLDFEGLGEDRLHFLLRKLDAMGYEASEIENMEDELPDILKDIKKSKPECKITLKTKGEFQNVYVDKVLTDDEDSEDDEDEDDSDGSEEDDDEDEDSDDEDEEDEDDEDEKPSKKKSKKSKKKDDDDDDEDEDEEEDDEDDEDEDDEDEKPKKKKGKKKSKDDDDEEDEEDEEEDDDEEEVEDEVDIVVGSIVTVKTKNGKVKGEVTELFENEGKILLKTEKGKTLKISAEKVVHVEEAPEESVPRKKKKKGKKSKK